MPDDPTANQLIDEYIPMFDPPDIHVNANALKCMAEGIHYDTAPGELSPQFAHLLKLDRVESPRPVYRWQRSLPGVRVIMTVKPRPRKAARTKPRPEMVAA